jgi:hypothetical protein
MFILHNVLHTAMFILRNVLHKFKLEESDSQSLIMCNLHNVIHLIYKGVEFDLFKSNIN